MWVGAYGAECAPGRWGAASEASGGGGGRYEKKVRERAKPSSRTLGFTPPPAKPSFNQGGSAVRCE